MSSARSEKDPSSPLVQPLLEAEEAADQVWNNDPDARRAVECGVFTGLFLAALVAIPLLVDLDMKYNFSEQFIRRPFLEALSRFW